MPNRRRVLRGVVTSVAEESRWCYRAKGVVKLPEQAEDEDEPEESQDCQHSKARCLREILENGESMVKD